MSRPYDPGRKILKANILEGLRIIEKEYPTVVDDKDWIAGWLSGWLGWYVYAAETHHLRDTEVQDAKTE